MLTRRDLLRGAAAAGVLGPALGHAAASGGRKLVVVFANGGWDSTFCMDPRLHHPEIEGPEVHEDRNNPDDREHLRTFGDNLTIACNDHKRPAVTRFFEAWGHETAALNGIWLDSIAHAGCVARVLTGSKSPLASDYASIHGHTFIGDKPLGSLDMSGRAMPGRLAASSGRTGSANQIKALVDPGSVMDSPREPYPLFVPAETDLSAAQGLLARRAERLAAARGGAAPSDKRLQDYFLSMDRAERLRIQSDGLLDDLQLGRLASTFTMSQTAVGLLENEVCQTVFLDTNRAWDSHTGLESQHDNFESMFATLDYLMTLLEDHALLSKTTVLVLSEMTRTPLRNLAGGKDHWGHTSAMLMGAVSGDRVSGGTDDLLESLPIDLSTGMLAPGGALNKYDNLAAGILELVGVDPERWLPGAMPFRGAHVA